MSNDISTLPTTKVAAPRGRLRFGLLIGAALIGGGIGGTGGFALADGGPWAGGWHHGPRLERIQNMVRRALDGVGANSAQEAKIHDIVASTVETMRGDAGRAAMHQQMIALLRAPTIDRAAVEKLRADAVAAFDAKSKTLVAAVLDGADQLTPDQRAQLATRAEAMMERHRMMMQERRGGPDGGGMDGHHREGDHPGPDQGPDGGPDKG